MPAGPDTDARDLALDALRGLAVVLMLLVNVAAALDGAPAWLMHRPWDGLGLADAVFPLFLTVSGTVLGRAVSNGRQGPRGRTARLLRRTVWLALLGVLLGALPLGAWDESGEWQRLALGDLRLPGVLQRIALCGALASALAAAGRAVAWAACAVVLVAYPLALAALAPHGDVQSAVAAVDATVFGVRHLLESDGRRFDPEGLVSTPAATVTVLLGALTAGWSRAPRALAGLSLVAAGLLVSPVVALNKPLWSSSYVLVTSGVAFLLHAAAGGLAATAARPLLRFLAVPGRQALFLYVLSEAAEALLGVVRVGDGSALDALVRPGLDLGLDPAAASVAGALAWLAVLLGVAFVRQRIRNAAGLSGRGPR